MYKISLYIENTIKGPRRADGYYGYLLEYASQKQGLVVKKNYEKLNDTTSNSLCVTALCRALHRVVKPSIITIFTNNQYLVNSFENDWISKWYKNGWKNQKGKEVQNAEAWKRIHVFSKMHRLIIKKVDTHVYTTRMIKEMEEIEDGGRHDVSQTETKEKTEKAS